MYQALYRKWRPQSFADVIGQAAVTDTLTKQVETGRLSHAYLFSGSRGTGKTTCAKILARAVNCENPFHGNPCNKCPSCLGIADGGILDVVEIDAASNNGVDNVRDLREEAIYTPASVKKRVYIIDEVHMFSASAFNALLKIMEEPPEHVIFVLATTEHHKVPATIASRCQQFVFKRISSATIAERLSFIAKNEGAELLPDAAGYIATLADGAMRDALSLLDQCLTLGGGTVTIETVEAAVGLADRQKTLEMAEAIGRRELSACLSILNEIYLNGRNLTSVLSEISEMLRDVLIIKTAQGKSIPYISARYTEGELSKLSELFGNAELIFAIQCLQEASGAISSSANKRIDAELCCVRLCEGQGSGDDAALSARVSELERKLSRGVVPQAAQQAAAPTAPVQKAPAKKEEKPPMPEVKPSAPPKREASPAESADVWKKVLSVARGKLSPGVFPLIAGAKAKRQDNMLILSADNAFAMQMLSKKENMDILREAVSEVSPGLVITTASGVAEKKQETSGIDELMAGIEDSGIIK